MKWTFAHSVACIALLVNCQSSFSTSQWYVSVGGGELYPQFTSNMAVNNNSGFDPPYDLDLYSTKKQNQPTLLLSVGRRWSQHRTWFPSYAVGLNYQHAFVKNIGGTVMQYSIPEFTNYTYHWNLTSNLFIAAAKLNLFQIDTLSPYVNVGVGSVVNTSSDYAETALPGITAARMSPGFADNSKVQFAYQFGAGVDLQVSRHLIFTLGYLYEDLGNVESRQGTNSWAGQILNLGSLHANSAFLSMTYLFNK